MTTATETTAIYAVAPYCSDDDYKRIKARAEELEAQGLETGNMGNSEVGDALKAEFGLEYYAGDEQLCHWYLLPNGTVIGEDRNVSYHSTAGALYNWEWDVEDAYDNHLSVDALTLAYHGNDDEAMAAYLTDRYDAETAAIALGVAVDDPAGGKWIPVRDQYNNPTGAALLCNPATAEIVGTGKSHTLYTSDFDYWTATYYRAPEGHYFQVGEGGARSRFASWSKDGRSCGYGYATILMDGPPASTLENE